MREDPTENILIAEKRVSDLLRSLPRIESTGDFEGKVRSRIANSKSVPQRKWLVPTVALGSLLVLFVFGIVFWPSTNSVDVVATEPPTEIVDTLPKSPFVESLRSSNEPIAPIDAVLPKREPETVFRNDRNLKLTEIRTRPISRPASRPIEGGFVDRGVTPARTINANVGSAAPVLLKEYFPMIGIDAGFENNAWVVRTVTPNSVADRTGVIEGDIVESIGSVRLAETTTLDGGELEPRITVRRGSELKTLDRGKP